MSSRMTSLGRDFTPLTEQCRKEAPPSVSTSPVTWYASSPIWKQQPKKKIIVNDRHANFPPKSNKTLSDCSMLVVLLAVASDWTGRHSPASCSSHPCCKRRPRRLLPMKAHTAEVSCATGRREESSGENEGRRWGAAPASRIHFRPRSDGFFLIGRLNNERGFN